MRTFSKGIPEVIAMFFVGVAFALLIGISLGLLGGGGSILTVPILLYVFHLPTRAAIAPASWPSRAACCRQLPATASWRYAAPRRWRT